MILRQLLKNAPDFLCDYSDMTDHLILVPHVAVVLKTGNVLVASSVCLQGSYYNQFLYPNKKAFKYNSIWDFSSRLNIICRNLLRGL